MFAQYQGLLWKAFCVENQLSLFCDRSMVYTSFHAMIHLIDFWCELYLHFRVSFFRLTINNRFTMKFCSQVLAKMNNKHIVNRACAAGQLWNAHFCRGQIARGWPAIERFITDTADVTNVNCGHSDNYNDTSLEQNCNETSRFLGFGKSRIWRWYSFATFRLNRLNSEVLSFFANSNAKFHHLMQFLILPGFVFWLNVRIATSLLKIDRAAFRSVIQVFLKFLLRFDWEFSYFLRLFDARVLRRHQASSNDFG